MSAPHSNEPLNSLSVRKSNDFIAAKYKSSLLENQVMAIALTRIEANAVDIDGSLEAKLYPGELKRLVSDPAHIYRDLKKMSKAITGHTMFLEDGKGNFKAFSVVTNADYIDGVLTIKFNSELRPHVLALEKNYTTFELSVMTDFKRNSSFRIYEVLKKEVYKIKPNDYKSSTQVEYNLAELRFIIGLANSDDESVKKAMSYYTKFSDWDALYDKLDKKEKKYEEWRDLQRRVLIPAQEELEEKSDIRFEFEGIREGRKIKRLLFTIYRNVPKNPDIIDEKAQFMEEKNRQYRQFEIPMDFHSEIYDKYVGHNNLSKGDIDLLLKKADYSDEKVEKAIILADKQPEIDNYMGWLIRCIERNYNNIGTAEGNHELYEVVNDIRRDVENNKSSIANTVWDRYKKKDDFNEFIYDVFNSLAIEQIELAYDADELCQMYADWHRKK